MRRSGRLADDGLGASPVPMLSVTGISSAPTSRSTFDAVRGAIGSSRSAPAASYARARAITCSGGSQAKASVRAMMRKSGSRRAARAARILPTISATGTTSLAAPAPQRRGTTWSSRLSPAAPASSNSSTA